MVNWITTNCTTLRQTQSPLSAVICDPVRFSIGYAELSLDEFETIRSIDYQGKTQEECACDMNVARTTVTAIYDSARKKLAQADVLICAGICGGAQMAMQEAGITLYGGNSGSADEAVQAFLAQTLVQNSDPTCDHHHEHGEGHSCGSHSCGNH